MINDEHICMITGYECDLNFLTFVLQLRKNPGKNPNQGNWPDRGSNQGTLGERQRCYPSTTGAVDMYRTTWYPESSYVIDANLKEVDREGIAQKLIFYFINIPFRAVQFDNITSKFDSVASFCYRFTQLSTYCSPYIRNCQHQGYQSPNLFVRWMITVMPLVFYPTLVLWNFLYNCHSFKNTKRCFVFCERITFRNRSQQGMQ